MLIEKCEKKSFVVIGKEGSTKDGADFINKLKILRKDYILRELNVKIMRKPPKDGRNGLFRVTNIFGLSV